MTQALLDHGQRRAAPPPRQRHHARPAWRWACARSRTSSSSSAASRSGTASCDPGGARAVRRRTELPESPDPVAASAAHYANEVVELLSELMLDAGAAARARRRAGAARRARRRRAERRAAGPDAPGAGHLVPAPEHRRAERGHAPPPADRGRARLRAGPRARSRRCSSAAAAAKVPAAEIRALLEQLRVRPVITAHPTEAKRVTVLEKHRRIYRRLVDLESPALDAARAPGADRRAPERDRAAVAHGRAAPGEADRAAGGLLGPALLQRDAVRGGAGPARQARARAGPVTIPGERWVVPPFFQFGSWIGGDRDGNPVRHQRRHPRARCWRTG